MKKLYNLSLIIFLIFAACNLALAQQSRGTVKGTVCTADNKPADNVTVALQGTKYGTITKENGEFIFRAPAGSYTIHVSAVGLMPEEQPITITAGTTVTVKFMLKQNAHDLKEVAISDSRRKYKVDAPSQTLRLNEPLLEVPQNIQVVTNDQVKEQQVFNMLEGVSRNVSGMVLQEHWGNYALMYGRGDRIAPFRNGFNIENNWGPLTEDMSFVDRIEFVKGPAGFMLANGNPSGFYNVVTKKPTGITRKAFEFSAGSYNTYRATADFDGSITKNGKLQYRLNLMGQMADSWRQYEFTNRFIIAPVLRYKFSDKTTLTAEYTYQFQRMSAFGSGYLFSTRSYTDLPRNSTLLSSNSPSSDMYDQSGFLTLEHKFSNKWKFTAQGALFNYKQNAYSYWIASINTNGDVRRTLGLWDAATRNKFVQAFVNGEAKTGAVVHRILGGVDIGDKYYIADFAQSQTIDPENNPFNIYNPNNGPVNFTEFDRSQSLGVRGANSYYLQHYQSGYIQDELGFLNQKLRLTLAARYTHAYSFNPYQGTGGVNDKKFTPRVGLSYSIDDATSIYGVYDQAFMPQNGNIFGGGKVNPITGNNMEAGIKRDWFNGKWSTSASVYQITKNNQLVADVANSTSASSYVLQVGQAKTHGVEFDARGQIASGLSLMLNYAYTNSEISKDSDTSRLGKPVPGFAKHVTNGWLTYRLHNGNLKGLGFSAGYQWQVHRYPWSLDTRGTDMPNYFRLDAGASYQFKKISLAVNVNNVLDAYLLSGGHASFVGPPNATVYNWQAEAPRNIRATIGCRF